MLVLQLRAFVNAGFHAVVAMTGHNGNQPDLRIVAEEFSRSRHICVVAVSDPELVAEKFPGDHAGRYEISKLTHIRPDLVQLDRLTDADTSPLGRFAQGDHASAATKDYGREIIERSLDALGRIVDGLKPVDHEIPPMSIDEAEEVWQRVAARSDQWCTLRE